MKNTLHIEITGDKDSGKSIVANVIQKALSDSGFQSVTQINDTGEPVVGQEPQSILDLVRESKPELFATPITISETTWAGDDEEETVDAATGLEVVTD